MLGGVWWFFVPFAQWSSQSDSYWNWFR